MGPGFGWVLLGPRPRPMGLARLRPMGSWVWLSGSSAPNPGRPRQGSSLDPVRPKQTHGSGWWQAGSLGNPRALNLKVLLSSTWADLPGSLRPRQTQTQTHTQQTQGRRPKSQAGSRITISGTPGLTTMHEMAKQSHGVIGIKTRLPLSKNRTSS